MKKARFAILSIIAGLLIQPAALGQSANKIIDRYKKAAGGGAIKRIKSTEMSGTIRTSAGATGTFSLKTASPDRLRIDIEAGPLKVSECYNGKSAWRLDSRGLRTLLGQEAKRLRLEALIASGRLLDLSRNRILAQAPSKASVEGRDGVRVEVVKDDARLWLFFDAASGLLVKQERDTSEGAQEIFYGDHRKVDGVMEPFSLKIKNGPVEILVAIASVRHNHAVEAADFHHPKVEGERPLPDLEPLLKSLIANQEKIEQLREQYSCNMTEVERKLDGSGRVKETESRDYEVTPVGREFVERLISVNGKELSASEREKEDRRVQKEVEDIIKRREKEQQKKEKTLARGRDPEDANKDRVTILDFLRISEITSVRRETFRGYEVVAFDFEPRKGFKPKNRAETIVSKLAGTVWVDENAQQVARLEARLTDSFKMGGGLLASVSPSTAFAFEQEKIDDQLWLPSVAEANISARVLLFAKFNRSTVRRYNGYKKYQIDSKYEIGKPVDKNKPDEKL
jgi:hypothetical protein